MAPKTKLKTPASTQKRGRSVKSNKRQLPPLFPTPHREADFGHNEDELMLKDVMTAFGSFNSRLAAHDAKLDEMAGPEELPLAADEQQPGRSQATMETGGVLDVMEEAVHCNIADHLRGTRPVYAAQEVNSPQPKKHQKAISGRLRTADNAVVKQIT